MGLFDTEKPQQGAGDGKYALDERMVAREGSAALRDVDLLMHGLANDLDTGQRELVAWADGVSKSSAERRWGVFDGVAAKLRATIAAAGDVTLTDLRRIEADMATRYQQFGADYRAGIADAFVIMSMPSNPDLVLTSNWLFYATAGCSNDRYRAALVTMLNAVYGFGLRPLMRGR